MARKLRSYGDHTILVVDDQEETLASARHLLEPEGHRVLTADSGECASALVAEHKIDLLLVDYEMLRMDHASIHRLRALDAGIPIILQCEHLDAAQRRSLTRDLGLHAIHEKGGEAIHLLELVESALASMRRVESAQTAQELRGLIVAKMCHDLRTSLHVIQGYTDLLRSDPSRPSGEIVAGLGRASEAALGLAQDYLELARLESPSIVLRRETVEIDALLEELRELANRQIGKRPLRFTTFVTFAGSTLYTDGEKLRAILAQLLANAIKFSPSGEIQLTVRVASDSADFVLADSGPGINEDDLAEVFSPFRQRRGDAMASVPGQGIGLAIALRLSVHIGGSLTVYSTGERGAIFTLRLPSAVAQPVEGCAATLH